MNALKIGDKISCYKGSGIITNVVDNGNLPTAYFVVLDNGEREVLMRWHLELKEVTK